MNFDEWAEWTTASEWLAALEQYLLNIRTTDAMWAEYDRMVEEWGRTNG